MMKTTICLLFLIPSILSAKVIVVGKGSVTSIRSAIEMAAPGDTILVRPGIYREGNLIINKSDQS